MDEPQGDKVAKQGLAYVNLEEMDEGDKVAKQTYVNLDKIIADMSLEEAQTHVMCTCTATKIENFVQFFDKEMEARNNGLTLNDVQRKRMRYVFHVLDGAQVPASSSGGGGIACGCKEIAAARLGHTQPSVRPAAYTDSEDIMISNAVKEYMSIYKTKAQGEKPYAFVPRGRNTTSSDPASEISIPLRLENMIENGHAEVQRSRSDGYVGVCMKPYGLFSAAMWHGRDIRLEEKGGWKGKQYFLGEYSSEVMAARAVDKLKIKMYLEQPYEGRVSLNFPPQQYVEEMEKPEVRFITDFRFYAEYLKQEELDRHVKNFRPFNLYRGVYQVANPKREHLRFYSELYVRSSRKRVSIGFFTTAEEAAKAYDETLITYGLFIEPGLQAHIPNFPLKNYIDSILKQAKAHAEMHLLRMREAAEFEEELHPKEVDLEDDFQDDEGRTVEESDVEDQLDSRDGETLPI